MREECLADKRALFITMTGEPVAYGYVSDRWRAAVGTGEHIARTILHTFLGIELGQEGTDMAMAANGQRHHGTAKAYQDDALAMAQRMKGQTELTNVAQDGDLTMFEFRYLAAPGLVCNLTRLELRYRTKERDKFRLSVHFRSLLSPQI